MMFDVVISSYRRPELVRKAVESCLVQGPLLRKVIVVDDASGDETGAMIRALADDRIVFHQREANGGIAATRRDAYALSEADWTVSIDSDHELLPGALERFATFLASLEIPVDILGARYRWDTGAVSPITVPSERIGYRERIIYSARKDSIGADFLCAISRRMRERVQWIPLRTGLPDTLFQLDLAREGETLFLDAELGLEKTTGGHSWTRGSTEQRWARRCLDAADGVEVLKVILARHGEGLAKWAPSMLAEMRLQGAFYALLSNQRSLARKWLRCAIREGGLSRHCLGLVALIWCPRCLLHAAYRLRG